MQPAPPGARAEDPAAPPVVLGPFEMVEDIRGSYSANTMSGTRFNSKLEDLASALSVVTKEQMSDFAMLDINAVFLHSANTEGTGDYTAFSIASDGNVADGVSTNPNNANRVRGMVPRAKAPNQKWEKTRSMSSRPPASLRPCRMRSRTAALSG